MPVKISKPAINLREELASLRNQGGLPKEDKLYLDDLVTNGDFSNGLSGWTNYSEGQGSATISNGKVVLYNYNSNANNEGIIAQKLTLVKGKTYRIKVDVSGQYVILNLGTSAMSNSYYQPPNFNSYFTTTFVAQADEVWLTLRNYNSGGNAEVDNVSVQEVGENLVTNGTFDSDSQWGKGVGWTISGGKASSDGSQTSGSSLTLNDASKYETGKTYTVTFTISNYSAGGVNPHIRGDAFGEVSGNGTHTLTGVVGTSSSTGINMYVTPTFVGSIDNVIVTEGSHQVIQSIPHGYDVKDVYIDGDLAREGEAYDYEVKTDGINQWLKPSVEPTATTETVVIGVRK